MSEKRARWIREVIETIALTLLLLFLVRLAIQGFRTDGQSMDPDFHNGEYVLVNKAAYLFGPPQRGDVVVFNYPLDPHTVFIKRIIGVPGDTVHTTATSVIVDGYQLSEPYISAAYNYDDQTWKLGPNQFFVMGDNRPNSLDSRIWGPLNKSYIIGKVVAAYWPVSELGVIQSYTSVFAAIRTGP